MGRSRKRRKVNKRPQNAQLSAKKNAPISAKEEPTTAGDIQVVTQDQPIESPISEDISAGRPLWRRSPISFFLVVSFLALQMWLPYRYYIGDYPWDERFSWRMFSTVRGLSCQVQAWGEARAGQPVSACPDGSGRCSPLRLSQELHMVWVNLLKRGRREVLRGFVEARCEQGSSQMRPSLYVSLACPHPQAPHPMITIQSPQVELCAHPEALLSSSIVELLAGEERR